MAIRGRSAPVKRRPVRSGLSMSTIVGGVVAALPRQQVRAESGAWHWAFMKLRDRHVKDLPELQGLEFSRRAGVWPISERLEKTFQVIDLSGAGSTLNPTLVVRHFKPARLKHALAGTLASREVDWTALGKELQELLDGAPSKPSSE